MAPWLGKSPCLCGARGSGESSHGAGAALSDKMPSQNQQKRRRTWASLVPPVDKWLLHPSLWGICIVTVQATHWCFSDASLYLLVVPCLLPRRLWGSSWVVNKNTHFKEERQWKNTRLVCPRPWVPTPAPQKKGRSTVYHSLEIFYHKYCGFLFWWCSFMTLCRPHFLMLT